MKNPLEKEVGGNHYQKYVMQPVELFMACGWNYCQSNIAKYVLRYKYKNGKEDLEKAIHICEIGLYYDNDFNKAKQSTHDAIVATFNRINYIEENIAYLLEIIDKKDYIHILNHIDDIYQQCIDESQILMIKKL